MVFLFIPDFPKSCVLGDKLLFIVNRPKIFYTRFNFVSTKLLIKKLPLNKRII